ncbi:peroxidase 44-like [Panicum miliaceum]|uniref:Peroxidase 44-like n=1 Tax=Panicum miliaceum TaxID=4540 RepID=A0A3L6SEC8_PANMI|nr:peroxidase 44-like [Panicum miliaceum]
MDFLSPNTFDSSYFGLALTKKMPLTIDRLLGMDSKTEPVLKAMEAKPTDFVPLFAKAMEKLSVLKVITGKDGEIRKTCSEFNTAPASGGSSVIRVSSLNPEDQLLGGLPQPGGRKAGGPVDPAVDAPLSPSELEAKRLKNEGKLANTNADEAAAKVLGGVVVNDGGVIQPPKVVPLIGEEPKKDAGVPAAGQVPEIGKAVGIEESKMVAPGNKVLGDEPGSKLPGPEEVKPGPKLRGAGL